MAEGGMEKYWCLLEIEEFLSDLRREALKLFQSVRELSEDKRVAVDLCLDPITGFQNSNREENSFLITFGFENLIPEQDVASTLSHMGCWFYKDYTL